jgi:Alpha amylase, catalytic domain
MGGDSEMNLSSTANGVVHVLRTSSEKLVEEPMPRKEEPGVMEHPVAPSSTSMEITTPSLYPLLYQVNTRILLRELTQSIGRKATFDDISDRALDRWAAQGFEWIWFLGVWQTGAAGRQVSLNQPEWQREFRALLPDLEEKDVSGSCFAITSYRVNSDFGGNPSLERLRDRLHRRGLRLLLDFVPNHTALDHPWINDHPEFYIHGTDEQRQREPHNYVRLETARGPEVLAYGRDPYFAGWPDTLQLNYAEPFLQHAMQSELIKVSEMCDGVRCDMAMLILPDVFQRTWGVRPAAFWPGAIESVRSKENDFLFMAEVYWDLEWTLQQQGFDYTYDKKLYDRLIHGPAAQVREHLRADREFQRHSVRFLENHDEPRAASVFSHDQHKAAAVIAFMIPGLRFFHDGQFEGRLKKLSVHLGRRPEEAVDSTIFQFYDHLLSCVDRPETRDGDWRLLDSRPAWQGNWTWECFLGFCWAKGKDRLLIAVNYAPNQSQCYLQVPFENLRGQSITLVDLIGPAEYTRDRAQLCSEGLFLDMPPWGYHIFKIITN